MFKGYMHTQNFVYSNLNGLILYSLRIELTHSLSDFSYSPFPPFQDVVLRGERSEVLGNCFPPLLSFEGLWLFFLDHDCIV